MSASEDRLRQQLAQHLEEEIGPRIASDGVYNCCGCSSYRDILDDAIEIVRRENSAANN